MMTVEIIQRLTALGAGGIDKNTDDFETFWQQIVWDQFLYPKDWNYYGLEDFYSQHRDLYYDDKEKFNLALIAHYFEFTENYYGQYFKIYSLFNPFDSSNQYFGALEGLIEPEELSALVDGNDLKFILLFRTETYPNLHFVCTSDPNPENPKVYSTDHETFFQEIESEGNLCEFLNRFLTKDQFISYAHEYIQQLS